MKIIPLSEGKFTVDKSKQFVPFNEQTDELTSRPTGSLLVEIQPFAVITSQDILVLDTGLGFSIDGKLQIHQNLSQAGINPEDVSKVLLSHLHKDHSGGIMLPGTEKLSFPNATYYLQEKELRSAIEKGAPSYHVKNLERLEHHSQVVLLEAGQGEIDSGIFFEVTGAHSPYHQVFRIMDQNKILFFGGDDAPQLQQMKHRFIAKYDYDGRKAMELRSGWWEKGQAENWSFLFYHDIRNPVWQQNEKANS